MSTRESFNSNSMGFAESVRVLYPNGCLPNTVDYDWNVTFVHQGEKYVAEHRPYPGRANLLSSLTSRERVHTAHAEMGDQYREVLSQCPHGGVHGIVRTRYFYSSVAIAGLIDFDLDSMITRELWAENIRRKLMSQRVNISSSIAEYKESVKMFYELAVKLAHAYRNIRKGKFSRAWVRKDNLRKVSHIPASILYYNFGVAPLVSDLFSVVEALRLKLTAPILMRTSASIKKSLNSDFRSGQFSGTLKGTFRQRATIYYDMDPNSYLSESFDFGNPLEWAWELIPFSFVIDWAIPIGSFLGQIDALTGISNLRGVVTTKCEQRYSARWDDVTSFTRPFTGYYRSYQRDTITSVPLNLPRWEPDASYMKLLNASSILATMVLNKVPVVKDLVPPTRKTKYPPRFPPVRKRG